MLGEASLCRGFLVEEDDHSSSVRNRPVVPHRPISLATVELQRAPRIVTVSVSSLL